MTPAQLVALRAACFADPTAAAFFVAPGNAPGLYDYLRSASTFVVYKGPQQVMTVWRQFLMADVAGLTTANTNRLLVLRDYGTVEPAKQDHREGLEGVWGTNPTKALLQAFWKRFASHVERLLSTGTGSDASPAVMGYEGTITQTEATTLIYKADGTLWTAQG